jgi:hypothetical protein
VRQPYYHRYLTQQAPSIAQTRAKAIQVTALHERNAYTPQRCWHGLLKRQAPNWLAEHRASTKLILGIGLSPVDVFDPFAGGKGRRMTLIAQIQIPACRRLFTTMGPFPYVRCLQHSARIFSRHNRAARKSKLKMHSAPVRRKSTGKRMRKERTLISGDGESAGYTFFFQIANDGGRRACCVKIEASNIQEASALFRQNWPVIETMARNGIDESGIGDGVITVVMP